MKLRTAWISVALLNSGCPQLLEDHFQSGDALAGTGGAAVASGGATNTVAVGEGGGGGSVADASAGGTTSRAVCSEGRPSGPGGDCYVVIAEAVTWQTGRTLCLAEGRGWDLATVRSRADTDAILPLLGAELWIGASDAIDEGNWLWIASGVQFWPENADSAGAGVYTNWNVDEPNNVDEADCLRLLTTGRWADLPCDSAPRIAVRRAPLTSR